MTRRLKGFATALVLGIVLFSTAAGCNAGAGGGMPDYCYVMSYSPQYIPKQFFQLHGHRKWSQDIMMGTFESVDDAKSAAEKVGCPFRK